MLLHQVSLRGELHKRYGVKNQDAAACGHAGPFTIAVLADGVSLKSDMTFSNSELAARFCTRYMKDWLQDHLQSHMNMEAALAVLEAGFQACNRAWLDQLDRMQVPYYDNQCTLLALVYRRGQCAFGIAGDGGFLFRTRSGKAGAAITQLKQSNAVYPLYEARAWRFGLYGSRADPVCAVIGATDGVFDNLLNAQSGFDGNLFKTFLEIKDQPEKRRQAWLEKQVQSVLSHDDKSCFVLYDGKQT